MRLHFNDELKVIAEAYSSQVAAANRYWLFCAFLTFVIVTGTSSEKLEIFGSTLPMQRSLPFLAGILAVSNIVYISAHMQAYHMAKLHRHFITHYCEDISNERDKEFFTSVAYGMIKPQINRLYPITLVLPSSLRDRLPFKITKFFFDLLLTIIPLLGIVISLVFVEFRVSIEPYYKSINVCIEYLLNVLLWFSVILSFTASMLFIVQSFIWAFLMNRTTS